MESSVSQIKVVEYDYLFVIKDDGSLWAKGSNTSGQLGLGSIEQVEDLTQVMEKDVRKVVDGSVATFVIKTDGSLGR